jgi:hypothetical protein
MGGQWAADRLFAQRMWFVRGSPSSWTCHNFFPFFPSFQAPSITGQNRKSSTVANSIPDAKIDQKRIRGRRSRRSSLM